MHLPKRADMIVGCIPCWYHFGMTTQIAVRLPDEIVEFLDQLVAHGDAKSRAAAVTRALELDRRRRMAERDAAIYISSTDPDMDRLAAWNAKNVNLSDLD
jgi:Arc/MetJ-type ribon-helix-helix transcriptional regulator